LSKGLNRVDVFLLSLEDGNRSRFGNIMCSSYLEFWRMDKVQTPRDSDLNVCSFTILVELFHNAYENEHIYVIAGIMLRKRKLVITSLPQSGALE
jgi:hypothetical protein